MLKEVVVRLNDDIGIIERRTTEAAADKNVDATMDVIVIEAEGADGEL
jgi:hypothetical protein